ncbi:hypothetical protein EC991_009045 [Linnemannia zychae]|nr:hypothetical protein EC991_009045 [Linnemannia zychae]
MLVKAAPNQIRMRNHIQTITFKEDTKSVVQQPPPPTRQFNPFAKGFSGLGANVLSNLSRPSDQQPVVNKPAPKPTTSNVRTDHGWRQNTTSYSTDSPAASPASTSSTETPAKIPSGNSSTIGATEVSTLEADISFDGDEFLLEGDERALADLMDDLDQVKDNANDGDIPLSWSPTPPKISQTSTTTTPLSPLSPLSRFGFAAHSASVVSTIPSASTSIPTSTAISKQTTASKSYTNFNSTSSKSISTIGNQDKPSSSFRASATAAAISASTFTKSFPKGQSESSGPSRVLVISSQEPVATRPNERDTMGNRDWQGSSKPISSVGHIQEQESKGLARSKSSPNAASSSAPSNVNKRTLPGPAGNLPRLSEDERRALLQSRGVPFNKDTRLSGITSTSPNSSIKKKMRSINQGLTDSMFETKPWKDMLEAKNLQDYKPSTLDSVKGSSPLVQVTISDIENRQHKGKIPWLVAIVKDFTPSEIDAAVTLMDPSGEMKGTVHNSVLEHYKNNEIRIGTVLVLNNVSLFSPTPMSHYIIITLRNIAGLYVLPTPSNSQSQGSSQDRSQKKRRTLVHTIDSQDGTITTTTMGDDNTRRAGTSLQPSTVSSHQPAPSRQIQQASPDWDSTPEGIEEFIQPNSSSLDGTVSQERRAGSSRNSSGDQNQVRRFSPYPSQEGVLRGSVSNRTNITSQDKEVMFQSLRQTLGSSMMSTAADTQAATPVITLGGLTPSANTEGGFKSLSSFAASPTLRKRSSQLGTSQRRNSSGSVQGKNKSQGAASQGSHPSDADDSMDWPDDFPLTELDGALDDEPSETGGSITVPAKRGPPSGGASRSPAASHHRPAPAPTIAAAVSLPTIHDDGDEDDLDQLLDGIDEAELFNLL